MRVLSVMAVLFASAVALATNSNGHVYSLPPPDPMGELPLPLDDGSYANEADACQACRFVNTGSCATYKTCICHAANMHFPFDGVPVTDVDNWKYACDGGGGSKYKQCFHYRVHFDAFGDEINTLDAKCGMEEASDHFDSTGKTWTSTDEGVTFST